MRKRPSLAIVSPSRPRRKISLAVAPTPPARRNPTPRAPTTTTGRLARSFPVMSVASLISSRRLSAAPASWSRSTSMSWRTWSTVRELLTAICLQRLGRELRFQDRLLRNGRRALLDLRDTEVTDHGGEQEAEPGRHEERRPDGHRSGEPGGNRGEEEADHEDREDRRAQQQSDAEPEPDDRAGTLCNLLDRCAEAVRRLSAVTPLGGHRPSSRPTWPGRCRRPVRLRRSARDSARRCPASSSASAARPVAGSTEPRAPARASDASAPRPWRAP